MASRPGPGQGSLFDDDDPFSPSAHSRPGEWLALSSSRVNEARYDPGLQQIHVIFKDGTPWTYDQVPPNVWRNFRRSYWQGAFDRSGGE
jgi:hypothetical protein